MIINDINFLQVYILFWARLLKYCIIRHIVPTSLLKINFNFLEFSANKQLSAASLKTLHASYPVIITNILEDLLMLYKLKKHIVVKHNYNLVYLASNNSLLKVGDLVDYLYVKKLNNLITDVEFLSLKNNLFTNFCNLYNTSQTSDLLRLDVLAFYDTFIDSYHANDNKRRTHGIIIKNHYIMNDQRFIEKLIRYFDAISRIYYEEENQHDNTCTEGESTNV